MGQAVLPTDGAGSTFPARAVSRIGRFGPSTTHGVWHGLSASRVGLQNGYARHIDAGIWLCQLEVEQDPTATSVPDFLGLATAGTLRLRREEPPILDFELGERPERGGLLQLRVVAHDAVGLLAAVLHRVAIRRRDFRTPRAIDRRAIATSLSELVRSR